MEDSIDISVLVPILNEEESLEELNRRLEASLESTGKSYEIIYINDGSTDGTQTHDRGLPRRRIAGSRSSSSTGTTGSTWRFLPDSNAQLAGP